MKNFLIILSSLIFIMTHQLLNSDSWIVSKTKNYSRITDSIIEDIDFDQNEEIIISYYGHGKKGIDIYKVIDGKLVLLDSETVPYYTVFFDVGDIDNDGKIDILFLASDGIYYRNISTKLGIKDPAIISFEFKKKAES